MALSSIQQTLWAKQMIALLKTKLISAQIANTNLVKGNANQWNIVAAGDVSTGDYSEDVDITYAESSDSKVSITPNIDKYVGLLVKDTDLKQTDIDWLPIMVERATYKLLKDLDTGVLGVYGDAGSDFFEDGASADWQFTVTTAAEVPVFFAKLTKAADDLDWPDQGRYVVGPSGFGEALATYTGSRASGLGDTSLMRGVQGMDFMGWKVFISNNCTTVSTTTHGLAGIIGDGIALGMQVNPSDVESQRAESRFGDLVRTRLKGAYKVYRSTTLIDVNFNSTVVATS